MRILRLTVTVLFAAVLCLYVVFNIRYARADKTYPVFTLDSDAITVPLDASDEDYLAGVHASDEKDGDLTDRVIVESISRFTEYGVSVIKYAVCDDDNHVSTASRKVIYENYTSPRFTLSGPLLFGISQPINILSCLGARDAIDGNIRSRVIVTADDYISSVAGIYSVTAKVTNSKGDMISMTLPVHIEDLSLSAPTIKLSKYLVYLKKGEAFDVKQNAVSALTYTPGSSEEDEPEDLIGRLEIDTNLNVNEPGQYEVHYRVTDDWGRTGHSILLVVVEE